MAGAELSLRMGQVKQLDNGYRISATRLFLPEERIKAGAISKHEIAHVAGSNYRIKRVSLHPEGDAEAVTEPEEITVGGAGAAAGLGFEGGGHDLRLAWILFKSTPEQTMAAGRAAVAGQEEEMDVLSKFLELRREMVQSDVNEGLQLVRDRKRGIYPVSVEVTDPKGRTKVHKTQSLNEQVMIEGEWIELEGRLPTAA